MRDILLCVLRDALPRSTPQDEVGLVRNKETLILRRREAPSRRTQVATAVCKHGPYGWITVAVRLITNASRRSRKSIVTSANASGRPVLIACPASETNPRWPFGISSL